MFNQSYPMNIICGAFWRRQFVSRLPGEPMRLKILQSVCHEPRTVNDIVETTGSTQANVSKHLALLAAAGILARQKDGQRVDYRVKDRLAVKLCKLVRAQLAD